MDWRGWGRNDAKASYKSGAKIGKLSGQPCLARQYILHRFVLGSAAPDWGQGVFDVFILAGVRARAPHYLVSALSAHEKEKERATHAQSSS